MSAHKEKKIEEKQKITSVLGDFKKFFQEGKDIEPEEEENIPDNSFAGMAKKLREQKEEELKETKELHKDVTEWVAGRFMHFFQLTGSALGERIHDMILGESSNDKDSEQ